MNMNEEIQTVHPASVEMLPCWNKYLELYQYWPESHELRRLVEHCHPKGDSWVNEGDSAAKETVTILMRLHGYELKWIPHNDKT